MKALVFEAPGVAAVTEVPDPVPVYGRVLVRPTSVGICHSDLGLLEGDYTLPIPWPVIPGHEWTGVVEEVGPGVEGFSPGDPVVGECALSQVDHFGFTTDGAAAERVAVDATWVHKLPPGFDATRGALVEPFTVGFAATDGVDSSDDVLVLGGGPIGLCALAAARGRGARVFVADPNPPRRELATEIGADATLDPYADDFIARVGELTGGRMASRVVEATGKPRGVADALDVAGYGATVVALGIDIGGTAPAHLGLIVARALTVRGQVGSAGVWPDAIRFLDRLGIDLSPLVSRTFGLTDAVKAIEAAREKSNVKIHIVPEAVGP